MPVQVYRSFGGFAATALLVVGWLLLSPSSGFCQQDSSLENPFEFSDPQKFFQQFFGKDSQEDRAAIREIVISRRQEQRIGKRGIDAYLAGLRRQKIKAVTRGEDIEYLRQLVAAVHPRMKNHARYRSIRVHVVESNKPDARSFPGGNLVFFRGILDLVENEATLVGVIGHELSHLDRGHQLYDAKRAKLAQETFTGGKVLSPDQFFKNGQMLMRSFSRPFRPEEETEADHDGVRWTYDAGYDPREMAKLFLRMNERGGGAGKGVPEFLRTHPFNVDRYQATLDQYEQLQKDRPQEKLYIGQENLTRRVPRSMREFDD
jgi:predicted Zn-dependent protease